LRPKLTVRRRRLAPRALIMTITILAAALAAGTALAASATPQTVQTRLSSRQIAFDHPVVVSGTVPTADAGRPLELEFLPAGSSSWQRLATANAGSDGAYRFVTRLRRSGYLRVLDGGGPGVVPAVGTASAAGYSDAERVSVSASLRLRPHAFAALGPQRITVRGHLLPAVSGKVVWLQARIGNRWRNVASARTGARGRFLLHFTPSGGSERIRVRFVGDMANARSAAPAGSVTVYQATAASWYYDGGSTACGFHATYGVANRGLPCGTRVRLYYGGRRVTAVVDDRGPYVYSRTWDLSQNTAGALGFGGVGTVWSSY
jgi:rare lipoprotein A